MKLSRRDLETLLAEADQTPCPRAKAAPPPNGMSRTERQYAAHLEMLWRAGEIVRFDREPCGLRLGTRCVYWPDFRVVRADGLIELHEVKGRSGHAFYAKEDAWIKLKVAAALHPMFAFRVVWPREGGGWESREV